MSISPSTANATKFSIQRITGYGFLWLWILMMFNSISLYTNSTNMREALYTSQIISLVVSVAVMAFLVIIARPNDIFAKNKAILVASCVAMSAGSLLTYFSDSQTTIGMLVLGISCIVTGIGSGVLFICWGQVFFRVGGREALVELSFGTAFGFLIGFLLNSVVALVALLGTMIAPLLSGLFAFQSCQKLYNSGKDRVRYFSCFAKPKLSSQTIFLFTKSLVGAVIIGAIQGFYDVISGYNTYAMEDSYGIYLFIAGFVAIFIMAVVSLASKHDSIFYAYRFSILMLCLGCLMTQFLSDNHSFVTVFIFAGYSCFCVAMIAICLEVSASFVINPARTVGLGFVALYGGEFLGELFAHATSAVLVGTPDLTVITLITVAVLLIAHLFLFTETDLIKIGIGETNTLVATGNISDTEAQIIPSKETNESDSTERTTTSAGEGIASIVPSEDVSAEPETKNTDEATPFDPAVIIAERYGLSPREQDVLPLLLEGRTIVRIQETLFISAGTVSTHIRHIYQKTGSANRQELIDLAKSISE